MNKEQIKHIIPAILPKSFEQLTEQLDMVADAVQMVQIDIVDGKLAPNKTWPFINDTGNKFSKIVKQEEGMPRWEEVEFEIDIMAADPVFVSDQWIAAGATRIIIHKKGLEKIAALSLAKSIKDKGVQFMLAFEIENSIDEIKEWVSSFAAENLIDGIQFMGIEHIGFQHQDFEPKVLRTISAISKEWPSLPISVDGGVDFDNARALIDAGAVRLVSGSLIFESDMPRDVIEHLEEVCIGIQL